MPSLPTQCTVELHPTARFDLIDVTRQLDEESRDLLSRHRNTIYCSHHTTAGYLEQNFWDRLRHRPDHLDSFLQAYATLFPPNADYRHDRMEERHELTPEQRRSEPKNADSHLTFIGAGMVNCVTYENRPKSAPVYFIDLDGVHEHGTRLRRTTVLGYDQETKVEGRRLEVPVSNHSLDSVNLRDPKFGIMDQLEAMVTASGVQRGRIDISVPPDESNAGLTVNEYETLLMRHDLLEVLRNPLRFMAERGRSLLRDPRAIPSKTINYAQYDLVHVLNDLMDATGVSESIVERLLARFIAFPATRLLQFKKSISLLVTADATSTGGSILHGTYQSPILVQWRRSSRGTRSLNASLSSFS